MTRAACSIASARRFIAYIRSRTAPPGPEEYEALVAAVALPPDPPAPPTERERALVRAGISHGLQVEPGYHVGPYDVTGTIIAAVDRTHPRDDTALLMRVAEAVARYLLGYESLPRLKISGEIRERLAAIVEEVRRGR